VGVVGSPGVCAAVENVWLPTWLPGALGTPISLAAGLLKPGQRLEAVRYFTAAVRNEPAALARQQTYLAALRAHAPKVEVIVGRFQQTTLACRRCGAQWRTYEEKETDVSIAVALLEDGVNKRFDTALVISVDSDLCPAVRAAASASQRASDRGLPSHAALRCLAEYVSGHTAHRRGRAAKPSFRNSSWPATAGGTRGRPTGRDLPTCAGQREAGLTDRPDGYRAHFLGLLPSAHSGCHERRSRSTD